MLIWKQDLVCKSVKLFVCCCLLMFKKHPRIKYALRECSGGNNDG